MASFKAATEKVEMFREQPTPESFALSWKEKQKMVAAMAIWAIVTHSKTCGTCASNDHSDTDQTDR